MPDSDVLQAIHIIDAKIASLQDARDQLARAFGIVDHGQRTSSHPKHVDKHQRSPRGGRKEQLAQFLFENGPTPRPEIVAKSGLPEGSISYCLSDERFFQQNDNGDWIITDFSRPRLENEGWGRRSSSLIEASGQADSDRELEK